MFSMVKKEFDTYCKLCYPDLYEKLIDADNFHVCREILNDYTGLNISYKEHITKSLRIFLHQLIKMKKIKDIRIKINM